MDLLDPDAAAYVIERMIAEAARYHRGFAIVRMQLPADDVPAAIPRLRSALRDADTLARWGQEELIAMLPQTDAAGARIAAQRLRETVRDVPVLAGAAEWTSGSAESLIRRAAWAGARP